MNTMFQSRARGRDHGNAVDYQAVSSAPASATFVRLSCRAVAAFQSARPRGARLPHIDQIRIMRIVSIRAPARGATRGRRVIGRWRMVSIRAPARGATTSSWAGRNSCNVSIRAPARGATSTAAQSCTVSMFQSARPRGARPPQPAHAAAASGFNPRAREGRDVSEHLDLRIDDVSIRAPARGATGRDHVGVVVASVSIRAPARGATNMRMLTPRTGDVSIRAPARGATRRCGPCPHGRSSIRAPARRATFAEGGKIALGDVSIRAPARGATFAEGGKIALGDDNPRAARGATGPEDQLEALFDSFNPRAREGRDLSTARQYPARQVSIRAPARGATDLADRRANNFWFQSARPRRDQPVVCDGDREHVSIRAPARGATRQNSSTTASSAFQSARPRGDGRGWPRRNSRECFNPRARGATSRLWRILDMSTFQSARPRGATPGAPVANRRVMFQSARPRARDCATASYCTGRRGFNPRAREGRDLIRPFFKRPRQQFQSARPRGARPPIVFSVRRMCRFQSARPRGARRRRWISTCRRGSFNPRAREGRDFSTHRTS